MKNQKGFSLVELLVVVIIIAIIAAIAIPNLLASRRAANEASAISSLRSIHSAQATYQATIGNNTEYADTLVNLGDLIDGNLSGGTKSGYAFTMSRGGTDDELYCSAAEASTQGTTGTRSFGGQGSGVIVSFPAAGAAAACDAGVLTGGTPIE